MKKSFLMILTFIFSLSAVVGIEHGLPKSSKGVELYTNAVYGDYKLFSAEWPFKYKSKDILYNPTFTKVDTFSLEEVKKRYDRMLHARFFGEELSKNLTKRIQQFSQYTPELIDTIYSQLYWIYAPVQHISIYGSFLYNEIDPDDVDLLVVVDSPYPLYDHFEVPANKILGNNNEFKNIKISFQILDYKTYQVAAKKKKEEPLTRAENLAQQQLAVGASWYFTIYGFDLRFDNPSKLTQRKKSNYLNKAFITCRAAGAFLFEKGGTFLTTEALRLRKVVSRLLITDFLLVLLDTSMQPNPKLYEELYREIRVESKKKDNHMYWISLQEKLEDLYFERLARLLKLAEKHSKIDQVRAM